MSWKKTLLFNWRQKKDRGCSKKEETEINDPKMPSGKKLEKLFGIAKDCGEEIKSLKSHMSQMSDLIGDFERMHGYAQNELHELRNEIKGSVNESSLSINEERNIDAKIICFENKMILGRAKLQVVKLSELLLRADLSRLQNKIKDMKKITSSNSTRKV